MKGRLFMTMLVALLGLTGTMRAENYNLWVCNTQVTSDNATDLSVIDGVSGKVSYDAATNTLTLENATLSCASSHAILAPSTLNGVTIAVIGSNSVTSTHSKGFGLYMQGTGLTITGTGSLSVLSPRAAIRYKGTLAISGGVQLTAEATSVGNSAYGIYPIGSGEHSVAVSGAGTVVRLKGRDWPMDNVASLSLSDGLQITAPEGAYLDTDGYIRVGTTMVENEWLEIMNPELEQTVEGERVMNLSRYDVDGNGSVSIADVTLLINAVLGKVTYPVTSLTLSQSAISLLKNGGAKLTASIQPADADLTALAWTTSNHLVATVDATGNVIGRSAGTCTITARTLDGSNLSATCQVMVVDPSGTASDYVDLGLPSGTLWATCNVGATKPEECGDYFAWGETIPKSDYNSSTYTYSDNPAELPTSADAAYVNWGSEWRMPSYAQFDELINSSYTTTTWTTLNGVSGWLITSIVSGYEGNSIFLPARRHLNSEYGYYWSRTIYTSNTSEAYYLLFTSSNIRTYSSRRYNGRVVRPVRNQ